MEHGLLAAFPICKCSIRVLAMHEYKAASCHIGMKQKQGPYVLHREIYTAGVYGSMSCVSVNANTRLMVPELIMCCYYYKW